MNPAPPNPRRRPRVIDASTDDASSFLQWLVSLPAIIGLLSCFVLAALLLARSPRQELPWYRTLGQQAMEHQDYQLSLICYQRLLTADPADQEAAYKLAITLLYLGRPQESAQLLLRLAPETAPGYRPAQLFFAEQLARQRSPTAKTVDAAERHLLQAGRSSGEDPYFHAVRALIYYKKADWAGFDDEQKQAGNFRGQLERWVHTR